MNKKICVSTYCNWTSYGSILQTLGLKLFLKEMGVSSFVVIDEVIPPPKKSMIKFKNGFKSFLVELFQFFIYKKRLNKYNKNTLFIEHNIDIFYFNNYEDLKSNTPHADLYLSGSDQVFNPTKIKPSFFLDYVNERNKRLTYGCSMGVIKIPLGSEKTFSKLINNFDYLSLREEDNIDVIKKYNLKAKFIRNIDPTLLINRTIWEKYETPYNGIGKNFILLYPLFWDKNFNKELKRLHKITKTPIVAICGGLNKVYANKRLYDVGVNEFIWLVHHAQSVITSSFHGLAFSLIFKKNFSVVVNPDSSSRISSLLKLFNIRPLEIFELNYKSIDYTQFDNLLEEEIKKSENYLQEVIFNGVR